MSSAFHVQVLREELERRKTVNKRYSLRAFARALGMDASALSRILSGKQDLSLSICLKIVEKLKFAEDQRLRFMASVTEEKRNKAASFLLGSSADAVLSSSSGLISSSSVLTHSPDQIYVTDRAGRFLFVNEAGARIWGLEPARMIGKTRRDLNLESPVFVEIEEKEKQVFAQGKQAKLEICHASSMGRRYYERILTPLTDESGQVYAVISDMREITERKLLEEQLRFLSDAGKVLASSLSIDATFENIGRLATHEIAEGCMIRLDFPDHGPVSRLAFARHESAEADQILKNICRQINLKVDGVPGAASTALTGEPLLFSSLGDSILRGEQLSQELLELHTRLKINSCACLPLVVRGRIAGVLILANSRGISKFNRQDLGFLMDFAQRAALALDNAILFEGKHSRGL